MSDQIDTLYEQFNLNQTALTNSVTLATAGPNETITVRDIQINNNNGRVLDLKIGGTTIITNTSSTSYTGTEYIGPGQSLTLTYRAGTYPPAAAAAPSVYCNTFELINYNGRATYWYNDAGRNANTVLPWSNTSTYYGTFSRSNTAFRHTNFPVYGSAWGLWVPTASDNYIYRTENWLSRYPGAVNTSQSLSTINYTATWNNATGSVVGSCAYDGTRYIYGLSNSAYNNNTDNLWGYYLKVDTQNSGSVQQIPFQCENYYDFISDYYDRHRGDGETSTFNTKWVGNHYSTTRSPGQILDGYYLVKPNSQHPFMLINLTTNKFRNLRFGKTQAWVAAGNFVSDFNSVIYFAKSASGDYIVGQYSDDDGYSTNVAPRYSTFDWWNIGPDLAAPKLINSGTFRIREDDNYNYLYNNLQPTRDPNNPSYYYVMAPGSNSVSTSDAGYARNNNYLKIIDFTYGYPILRDIRAINSIGFGSDTSQFGSQFGYIIPSLTNYTYTAPATPAFGTVDVRVAGIRSSI